MRNETTLENEQTKDFIVALVPIWSGMKDSNSYVCIRIEDVGDIENSIAIEMQREDTLSKYVNTGTLRISHLKDLKKFIDNLYEKVEKAIGVEEFSQL